MALFLVENAVAETLRTEEVIRGSTGGEGGGKINEMTVLSLLCSKCFKGSS